MKRFLTGLALAFCVSAPVVVVLWYLYQFMTLSAQLSHY